MFAGHFGLAAAVKAMEPKIPLWALMVSTQLLDIAFVPLLLTGVESMETIGDGGYGEAIIHADYSHSLVGALVLTLIAGLIAWRVWNRRSAVIIGSLTFSHWLLDLLVHRSDMPILTGNFGDLPLLGFRLWELPTVTAIVEVTLVLVGAVLYFRSVMARSGGLKGEGTAKRYQAYLAGSLMALLLILSFLSDYFSI
ncbi:MAG: permease [Bacillota bacterium]